MPDNANAMDEQSVAIEAGQRLKAAREASGLSISEVSAKTHLDADVVTAIEAGEFSALGAPVFVRGHLRGYARLVGLPEAEIVAACADSEAVALPTHSSPANFGPGFSIVNAALLAGLVLVLLIALIYWVSGDDEDSVDNAGTDLQSGRLVVPSEGATSNNTARFVISDDIPRQV